MGNLCCAREHSVQFFVQFFTQLTCTVSLECMGPLTHAAAHLFDYLHSSDKPTDWNTEDSFGRRKRHFSETSSRALRPKKPPTQWGLREVCSPSPGVKQLWRKDYSPLPSAQVKSKWSYSSVTLYAFMVCTGKYLASTHNTQFIPSFYRIYF